MTEETASKTALKKIIDLPPGAKLAYTVDEAGPAMGVSRTTVFDMIRNGEVMAKKLRGRTIITRDELLRVIDQAPPARAA
ncbi:helix-turn-helix domain-containing protein [Brevundimonas vesicularis]|uniref:DNA-binding protein n=1 Tax=Brevundimonas vesicularis TaxID=41276 RepID=A0A1Z3U739_BREVE|nr:helix-turn-helix domain-containing protein [Brevundimonas vesicularis]ASE39107.1 DNA-binding protein [Brevundimonas vesicularis]